MQSLEGVEDDVFFWTDPTDGRVHINVPMAAVTVNQGADMARASVQVSLADLKHLIAEQIRADQIKLITDASDDAILGLSERSDV